MIKKASNISVMPVPRFYSSNATWNTLGKVVRISYIYDREKGNNGKSN